MPTYTSTETNGHRDTLTFLNLHVPPVPGSTNAFKNNTVIYLKFYNSIIKHVFITLINARILTGSFE